tara:strand:- start:5437 stop:6369 length:933 start_codon:yes stop_codon:yes gene_type:complete
MSTISSIADKVACGGAAAANTGKLGCLSLFGTPEHLLAFKKGTVIPGSTEFNLAYLEPLIQKGTVVPILGASAFEDVSAEDTYSTNSSGVKRLNLKGLVEYSLTFEEGHEFYREIAKLEGYKNFDFMIGDDEGNWMLATRGDGSYRGFTAGHFTPEMTKRKVAGGDAEMKKLMVQFTERIEFDTNYAILHQAQLDFSPVDIPSVNGVNLSFTTIPADGETSLSVKACLSGDNNTLVEGLDVANFVYTVDGSTVVPSGVAESSPGNYTLTVAAIATSEVLVLDLWDGALNVDVTKLGSVLYRSDELTAVVV